MNNNEVGNTTLQQMPKKKMLLFTGLTIILVIMVIIGLSARTTINDAKSVLSYNSMKYYTHEDGVVTATIPLADGTMFGTQNHLVVSKMEKKFGTPSHEELVKMCADARDYNKKESKMFYKGNIEIKISPLKMKNSTLAIYVTIKEN